jgi:hypothetical protein
MMSVQGWQRPIDFGEPTAAAVETERLSIFLDKSLLHLPKLPVNEFGSQYRLEATC